MARRWLVVGVALLATGACAGGDDEEAAAPAPTSAAPPSTPAPVAPTAAPTTTEPPATTTQVTSAAPVTSAAAACPDLTPGVNDITLDAGGAVHPVRVFIPSSFDGQPLPTVLDWHGLGSDGVQQAVFSGYEDVAETEGFIVVHPTGVPGPGDTRNSWELGDEQDPGRDDLAFADALIDELVGQWCADPARIYSTGMSNGGFFTARLVCQRAERIAAAASVAGTYHPDGCAPSRAVPYLAFHGTDDLVVPFAGGGRSILTGADNPVLRAFFEQVIPEEFAQFAADAGCGPDPAVSDVGEDVIRYDYAACAAPQTFFQVDGGGHTWPGSPIGDAVAGALGYTTDDVDATADGWAFFQQHALPG